VAPRLEKSEPQINNINALHGPFRRLLFNSGLNIGGVVVTGFRRDAKIGAEKRRADFRNLS
jgi:hypothetical protein